MTMSAQGTDKIMRRDLQVRYDGDDLEREELDGNKKHASQRSREIGSRLTMDTQNKKGVVAISANRV